VKVATSRDQKYPDALVVLEVDGLPVSEQQHRYQPREVPFAMEAESPTWAAKDTPEDLPSPFSKPRADSMVLRDSSS
jgi:hypothetical protein